MFCSRPAGSPRTLWLIASGGEIPSSVHEALTHTPRSEVSAYIQGVLRAKFENCFIFETGELFRISSGVRPNLTRLRRLLPPSHLLARVGPRHSTVYTEPRGSRTRHRAHPWGFQCSLS